MLVIVAALRLAPERLTLLKLAPTGKRGQPVIMDVGRSLPFKLASVRIADDMFDPLKNPPDKFAPMRDTP